MADSTNSIDISVRDQVSSDIAPKLIAIGDAADASEKKLGNLKSQIKNIDGTGLASLLRAMTESSASASTLARSSETLTTATRASGVAADAAAVSIANQAAQAEAMTAAAAAQAEASDRLAGLTDVEAAAYLQLAEATIAVKTAKSTLAVLSQQAATSFTEEEGLATLLASALVQQAEATEQLALAKTNLVEVTDLQNEASAQSILIAESEATSLNEKMLATRALEASEAQLSLLEREMGELRREDIVLLDSETVSSARAAGVTEELAGAESVLAENIARKNAVNAESIPIQNESVAATRSAVSANVSAAAAMGIFEGRTLSMNRAAAQFITKILGLGGVFQAIFPLIGAAAIVAVIYQAVEGFNKMVSSAINAGHNMAIAFDGVINPLRKTNDEMAVTNDKLEQTLARLEKRPTTNGAQLALDQARESADRLDTVLERDNSALDKLLSKNRINAFQSILTGNATTQDTADAVKGQFDKLDQVRKDAQDALDKAASDKDPKAAKAATLAAYDSERKAILGIINALNDQYNVTKKIQDTRSDSQYVGSSGYGAVYTPMVKDQTANLTMLGKSVSLAKEELRSLDLTMSNQTLNSAVDAARDHSSALTAENKLAAQQWKQLKIDYEAYQRSITDTGHKPTPQQKLGFLTSRESTINPLNAGKLQATEQPLRNEIAGQQFGAEQITKLQDQVANMDKYGNALKTATEYDRIMQEAQAKGLTLDAATIAQIKQLTGSIETQLPLQQEKTRLWREATRQEDDYKLALTAAAQIEKDHPELTDAISRALGKMKIALDDLNNPLNEFEISMKNSRSILGQYGDELEVSQRVEALGDQLRRQGNSNWASLAESRRKDIALMVEQQHAQAAEVSLYNSTIDVVDRLKDAQNALNKATIAELSNEAKQSALVANKVAINSAKLETGQDSSSKNVYGGAIADYAKGFTTLASSIQNTMKPVFKTLADGFADSIGRAIVYAQNLGQALKEVARSAISELLSGLIKIGIQMLIVAAAEKIFGQGKEDSSIKKQIAQQAALTTSSIAAMAAVTAAGIASASALSAVWWPVAEAVSLASYGSNAIGAATGISAVMALGTVAAAPKLATGTNYVPSDMLAQIHQGERVIPKADNEALMSALKSPQGSNKTQMKVEVHNHGSSHVQVEQLTESHVRLIVRDETPKIVAQHAPNIIANDIANPNSRTSKALYRNVTPSRVR